MIVALPFMMVLKAMLGSALGWLAPVGLFFKSARGVIILILLAAVVIGGGWLYHKHTQRADRKAETITQIAVIETKVTQENVKTLQMSHEIDLSHLEKDAKVVTVIAKKAEETKVAKKAKIATIKKTLETEMAQATTPEQRQAAERKAHEEASAVQIASLWKTYCDSLTPGSESHPSCVAPA